MNLKNAESLGVDVSFLEKEDVFRACNESPYTDVSICIGLNINSPSVQSIMSTFFNTKTIGEQISHIFRLQK